MSAKNMTQVLTLIILVRIGMMMMMIVLIAASKRQIPIRCNGHITGDVTREVKSSLEKNINEYQFPSA